VNNQRIIHGTTKIENRNAEANNSAEKAKEAKSQNSDWTPRKKRKK
jgi:hypothetical protein